MYICILIEAHPQFENRPSSSRLPVFGHFPSSRLSAQSPAANAVSSGRQLCRVHSPEAAQACCWAAHWPCWRRLECLTDCESVCHSLVGAGWWFALRAWLMVVAYDVFYVTVDPTAYTMHLTFRVLTLPTPEIMNSVLTLPTLKITPIQPCSYKDWTIKGLNKPHLS